ncbi:hypothetical protein MBFIL_14110 [Methanobrevibacter filiformis]|uniref:Transposase IS66 family protein n=2 Tax=Methanobrevibacter filiformis TaxID=55758 RepID=A0A166C6A4_9EURY|nr:hypothetical protein MBFIL_14110 [Methanobrevibacter filiformis]
MGPVKNLEFQKHQLCIWHFIKIVKKKVKNHLNTHNVSDDERNLIKKYSGRIISIFNADEKGDFIYRINRFFKVWNDCPGFLKDFYNKKIVRDMHKLTAHLFDPNIPKTNNQIESKFSGAQQKEDKKRFKTKHGAMSYLKPIIERQNDELKWT